MPSIKKVAEIAGVSVSTGSVPVSEPLRLKVQAAIRQLDYHPNHVARSLKTSKTQTLGIIVPDMTITFFPQLIRGAETAARQRGYSLIDRKRTRLNSSHLVISYAVFCLKKTI